MVLRDCFKPMLQGLALGVAIGVRARAGIRAVLQAANAIVDPIAFAAIPIVLLAAAFFA